MDFFEFNQRFPNEDSSDEYLRNLRIKGGIKCKKCDSREFYWKSNRLMFECKQCKNRFSFQRVTIFENSNVPLSLWFNK
jgi:hypothetical protein